MRGAEQVFADWVGRSAGGGSGHLMRRASLPAVWLSVGAWSVVLMVSSMSAPGSLLLPGALIGGSPPGGRWLPPCHVGCGEGSTGVRGGLSAAGAGWGVGLFLAAAGASQGDVSAAF